MTELSRREFGKGLIAALVLVNIPMISAEMPDLDKVCSWEWWFVEIKRIMENTFEMEIKPNSPEWVLTECMAKINSNSYVMLKEFTKTELPDSYETLRKIYGQ